jgi:hypothetical protein
MTSANSIRSDAPAERGFGGTLPRGGSDPHRRACSRPAPPWPSAPPPARVCGWRPTVWPPSCRWRLRPGTRLLLDGPHGSYRPRRHAERFVLIAGGIGITPIVSLLRTAADAGDHRPFLLVYASRRWEQVTFREQLEHVQQLLELRVVHVLTEPPPSWAGEAGYIDAGFRRIRVRRAPRDDQRLKGGLQPPPTAQPAASRPEQSTLQPAPPMSDSR